MIAGNSPRLGRYGGNSARLTKCNCLAGYRVQPAPTRPGARRSFERYSRSRNYY